MPSVNLNKEITHVFVRRGVLVHLLGYVFFVLSLLQGGRARN